MPFENVLPAGADTLLTISGLGGFQYQARKLTQTLFVIPAAKQLARTINGVLTDISNPAFRKYGSTITCTDVDAPPLDNLWPGMEVTVGCAAFLCYETGNPGSPARPEVSGSSYVNGRYTFYNPVLLMRVANVKENFDEWDCANGWELELEET